MTHLYSIPAGESFVDVLAARLLHWFGTGEKLTNALIFVPTHRAALALRDAFFRQTQGAPLLLPRIQPLGDADIDALIPELLFGQEHRIASLPEAMAPWERLGHLRRKIHLYYEGKGEKLPEEQEFHLAGSLAELIDLFARERVPLETIRTLAPQEYARHWEISLDLLEIIIRWWPELLEREGKMDGTVRRHRMLELLSEAWRQSPPQHPVIIAGTTGSNPATAELICTVMGLKAGYLVLPGYDTAMDAQMIAALEPSHPQWGMARLLEHCQLTHLPVEELRAREASPQLKARSALMHLAMLPPGLLERWRGETGLNIEAAVTDVHLLECEHEEEEAIAITLLLREVLEHPGKRGLLVTHDRALARRVTQHLLAYDIRVNDSAGVPLMQTPSARLLLLVADVLLRGGEVTPFLALLKHPMAHCGMDAVALRQLARQLEMEGLRGKVVQPLKGLLCTLAGDRQMQPEVRSFAKQWARWLEEAAVAVRSAETCTSLLDLHLTFLQRITADVSGNDSAFWQGQDGVQLQQWITQLQMHAPALGVMSVSTYRFMLVQLLNETIFRAPYGTEARIDILSPMEARLQQADRVILGGMNEESWPGISRFNPWLSIAMQERAGLPGHAHHIGLSAHDVEQLAMAPEIILTRMVRKQGANLQASRWIMRLKLLLQLHGMNEREWSAETAHLKAWAAALVSAPQEAEFSAPEFAPPTDMRPTRYTPTGITRLIQDPYAFYAKEILLLQPLEPLENELEPAEFGSVVHEALREFSQRYPAALPEDAHAIFLAIGREEFAHLGDEARAQLFWWPRFERAAELYITQERSRRAQFGAEIDPEISIEKLYETQHPFTLKARVDRVEKRASGEVLIADYKTGQKPGVEEVVTGRKPQLTIEAFLYEDIFGVPVSGLEYWRIGGGEILSIESALGSRLEKEGPEAMEKVVAEARAGCLKLVAHFMQDAYIALPQSEKEMRYHEYLHLERQKEWNG